MEREYGSAFLESTVRCKQHIHPVIENVVISVLLQIRHVYPSRLPPGIFTSFLALLIRIVAPDMMYIIQSTDLREKSRISLVVIAAKVNSARPVVSPFNHSSRFQSVGSHLIDVVSLPRFHNWPVAESEKILQVPCP